MKEIKVYFVDDILKLVYNGRIIEKKLKNIISKGRVINREKFMEEFMNLLKKEKIKNRLFGDKIHVIKNLYFNVSDEFFLEHIFLDLGFVKVIFLDIRELLPDDDVTFIEFNDSYMVVYTLNGIYIDLDCFKDLPKILSLINIKDNIYLFGVNDFIPQLKFDKKNVYYFENYKTYITESLLKINKCDV